MPHKKGKAKDIYKFLINSNYYEIILKHIKDNKSKVDQEEKCDNLSTNMFFKNSSATEICKEFKFLYKSFSKYPVEKTNTNDIFTDYDCDFLNYWLNDKLRENVDNGSIKVKEFYREIKDKDVGEFTKNKDLNDYLHVIDPNVLVNMKLLYNLYDNAVKIKSIIDNEFYINDDLKNEEEKSCSKYTKECDENYKEAMDRCLNSNDDFYNALKNFKVGYKIITEPSSNKSNACNSSEFYYFPAYDAILEKKKNAIKISSTLLVLSFALPLIYKYTPFGPFLRAKINMVKDRWMNSDKNGDELLPLSTDIEDIIFDNENYNIGYYSETN
ncbi:PIR Superfamily Protein [Plasmodium ovale wallikeri]|uniref:PIR Superfamily Protein n=1 Tax=Plasmodium ovale wallikeri TaxID=864142 RepID=A0A1A9AIH3_PLAOA|nr:PIR Superfamily Protein [Plasmodium ovale wallikeri]